MVITDGDMSRMTAWFNAVQDLNPAYLNAEDYKLILRMYEYRGLRVPNSIKEGVRE